MSPKTIGLIFASYVIAHIAWLLFSETKWLYGQYYYIISEFIQIALLIVLFVFVLRQYTRKNALMQIKHEMYRSLYESDHHLVFLLDPNGFFMHMNTTVAKEVGISEENAIGRHYTTYVQREIQEDVTASFQTALRGEIVTSEIAFMTKKGKNLYAKARYSPIVVGGRVASVVVALKDVTENTNVKKALRETQQHLKLINEHASEMIAILNEEGQMVFTTPSFEWVFGEKPDNYYGKNPLEALRQPGIVEDSSAYYVQCLTRNEKMYYPFVREREKGTFLYFEAVGTPIVEASGEIKQMVCVVRDMTERRKQEAYLHHTERLHMLGEMAAGIAHEIKNPLTSIRGFVELFASKNAEEQDQPYYKLVLDELERINKITHELLTFSKPKEQKKSLITMEQIIDDVKLLLNSEAATRAVFIHQSLSKERTRINGDEVQLKQVFINVLKNAIEASKAGDRITIEAFKEPRWHVIRITDEGCGIEEDRMAFLGDAFHTSKEEGTGLGLMVSKRILAEHDGTIHFESVFGQGTKVEIRLPYVGNK